jgi:DNA-binding NarL/FixJ family response regulator
MKRPRVLIADDHALVTEGFRRLLEPHYVVVGIVGNGEALLDAARRLQPDVVLIDISMPLINGIDAARRVRAKAPQAKLIFVTMHAERAYLTEAFRAGASGYLLKRCAASELRVAIEAVLEGGTYVTPLIEQRDEKESKVDRDDLSPRQRDVVRLIAQGRPMKQIADILQISIKTVEFHKSKIMQRLGLQSTAELVRYAVTHGILVIESQ